MVELKICSKCKETKFVLDFYKDKTRKDGYRSRCKICCNIESSDYQKLNPHITIKKSKKFRENNPNKIKEIHKKWRDSNVPSERERSNNWKKNNKNKVNNYKKERRKTDSLYKIKENLRNRIRSFLKLNGIQKLNRTFDIVGCSPEFLKEYLEKKFTDGMSWDLIGNHIHIDHIIPLSSAKNSEEVYKLCHYTNLQPLWSKDNLSKGCKII
jgi:hypothetical protein